jgi:hypothetical protein
LCNNNICKAISKRNTQILFGIFGIIEYALFIIYIHQVFRHAGLFRVVYCRCTKNLTATIHMLSDMIKRNSLTLKSPWHAMQNKIQTC